MSTAASLALGQAVPGYGLDFVATAATGYDFNDSGDVVGRAYTDPGCGPFCLPTQELVAWRGGIRIALPLAPGYTSDYQYPFFINSQGAIAGLLGYIGSATRVAVWLPNATGYTVQDLGVLPGMSSAEVGGIDDQGRIVGWTMLGGAIPSAAAPFMWSQATGMVDLKAQGYPSERPAAISPGGKIVTWNYWYQLGEPASALPLPALPRGYVGAGSNGSSINDAGDQAHFLVSTSTQNLVYPFRLSRGGAWQMISSVGTGHLSRSGMGSINAAQDVTFTAGGNGMIAFGPAGLGQSLAALVSPAYGGAAVTDAGPVNASGQILAQAMIGRSQRLVKLTPVTPCTTNCLVVSSVAMTGQFVQDPALPGSCIAGGKMYNVTSATVTVTSETGAALANVQVSGRFLDDYWTDHPVTGTTNASGVASWTLKGPCGVGAVAFLLDQAALGTRSLDRTRGMLTNFVIPGTTPPPNQRPVAVANVTCATLACSFDGRNSTDDVGVTAYEWRESNNKLLSTQPSWSRTYGSAGSVTVVLTVFDGGGLSDSRSFAFDPAGWPPPPGNQPPVPNPVVTCVAGKVCTFDGSGSYDPDGTIASYRWTASNGAVLSTQAVFAKTLTKSGKSSAVLQVTDNAGLSAAKTVTFAVLR